MDGLNSTFCISGIFFSSRPRFLVKREKIKLRRKRKGNTKKKKHSKSSILKSNDQVRVWIGNWNFACFLNLSTFLTPFRYSWLCEKTPKSKNRGGNTRTGITLPKSLDSYHYFQPWVRAHQTQRENNAMDFTSSQFTFSLRISPKLQYSNCGSKKNKIDTQITVLIL